MSNTEQNPQPTPEKPIRDGNVIFKGTLPDDHPLYTRGAAVIQTISGNPSENSSSQKRSDTEPVSKADPYPWEQKGDGYESTVQVWNRLAAKKHEQGLTPEETSLMKAAYEATDVSLLDDLQM